MITTATQSVFTTTLVEQGLITTQVSSSVQVTTIGSPGPQGAQGDIPEAPLTNGPYGRDAAAWVQVMASLLYDPAGVRANCFNLANQSGNLDGGVFT